MYSQFFADNMNVINNQKRARNAFLPENNLNIEV